MLFNFWSHFKYLNEIHYKHSTLIYFLCILVLFANKQVDNFRITITLSLRIRILTQRGNNEKLKPSTMYHTRLVI